MDRRKNPPPSISIERARQMRREPTYPETLLWRRLRANQLCGLHFRRQHPIGPYIVDYYCGAAKLAVELDGESHEGRETYDQTRAKFLQAAGVRVVRFSDDDVIRNPEGVLHVIACECGVEV